MQNYQEETDLEEENYSTLSPEKTVELDKELLELGSEISSWRREMSAEN